VISLVGITLKTARFRRDFVFCTGEPGEMILAIGTKISKSIRIFWLITVYNQRRKGQKQVLKDKVDSNKSIYIAIVLYKSKSGKRTIGNKSASTNLLAVCLLVSVAPGDFFGIFSRKLRYIDQKPPRAIKGPVDSLWLDYSETTGKLNQIRIAKPGKKTNICLAWEGVNKVKGEETCQYWRVLVIATRDIIPFDQLIRLYKSAGPRQQPLPN
jgi:hypothetical protein